MNQPDDKLYKTDTHAFRDRWIGFIYGLQDRICTALETLDGRPFSSRMNGSANREAEAGPGLWPAGASSRKAGVNTSVVWGKVTDPMRNQLKIEGDKWFACGLSLVIHPLNPYVPTTHANWRYFEVYDETGHVSDRWFGGGSDLTPYYLFEEDARHFHTSFKIAMDPFDREWYPRYKKWCDEYFINSHRDNEMRGIGGVFYDHLRPGGEEDADRLFAFQQANGDAFLGAYLPIVEKRAAMSYGEREVEWQEIRRGRYVEFNLIHDRGTLFGLKTNGRTESILMSLPPRARWSYNFQPAEGSPEEKLLEACRHPREWAS